MTDQQWKIQALVAVCTKLRTVLDALRPFPLVVEPVAAALIAEADAALALVADPPTLTTAKQSPLNNPDKQRPGSM